MPEFVLEGRDHAAHAESDFVLGFIEAMFFTESSPAYDSGEWLSEECQRAIEEGTSDGTLPGDTGYTDLHPDSLKAIRAYCERKQGELGALLLITPDNYDETQAGRDLWFTSQGYGVGYWSRDELEIKLPDGSTLGDKLSEVAGNREVNTWFDGTHVHVEI